MHGSVQRVFDATAILQLYERGLIDLDADINVYIMELVTGIPYPIYMEENIFNPLGMVNTGCCSQEFIGQHAIPHTRIDDVDIELPVWNGNEYMMGTTAEYMAQFLLAHINNGSYNQFQLVQPQTMQLMQTKTSHGKNLLNLNSEITDPGYALGLIHFPNKWLGHGGSTVGYQSLWQFNPKKQGGFVILSNTNGILGGYDDFQSEWKNMSAVRDILLSEIDSLAAFDFFPWGFVLLWIRTVSIASLFFRWFKKEIRRRYSQ